MRIEFNFPEPQKLGDQMTLWGTYYYIHAATAGDQGTPLLSLEGSELGPKITPRDWCMGACEGTIRITEADGRVRTYNYAGIGDVQQVNCAPYFPKLRPAKVAAFGRTRFRVASGPHGDGSGGFILAPMRSIAVDRAFIPLGSVIFIPQARGMTVQLSGLGTGVHDGYFFAADTGGMIKGNHIDFFLGTERKNPFPRFVKSNPEVTFEAYMVEDRNLLNALRDLHTPPQNIAARKAPEFDLAAATGRGNFFTEVIRNDPRYLSPKRIGDTNLLEPVLRAKVPKIVAEAKALGLKLMVFETYRSQERQEKLYKEGRTSLREVGVHHYGLACDLVRDVGGEPSWDGDFTILGQLAQKHHLIWGGLWKKPHDPYHVQRIAVNKQEDLFSGEFYPDENYEPI